MSKQSENNAVESVDIDSDLPNDFLAEMAALEDEARNVDGDSPGSSESVEDEAPDIETSEFLMGLINPTFDVLAPNWKVKENEKRALATAYGALLDKYFPDSLGEFGVELSAAIITLTIFSARIGTPRVEEKKSEKPVNPDPAKKAKPDFSYARPSGAELGAV